MRFLAFLDLFALPRFRRPFVSSREQKRNRAFAIACASVSFRGTAMDVESLLSLADEYLEYIEGDDEARIPRPDVITPGRLPRR